MRGTRDILPAEHQRIEYIIHKAKQISARYGFAQIDTPLFEATEVFTRGIGETSDVVSKEMYTFLARDGKTSLTLRPENTAGVMRAFLSNGLAQQGIFKAFYAGPMFRYERPQKGRYRQFHQIGVELIGTKSVQADIECIMAGKMILEALDLSRHITLELNTLGDKASRIAYRTALVDYFNAHKAELSEDSLVRLDKNPLRILDSKEESDKALVAQAPSLTDYLNTQSQDFFEQLTEGLNTLGIAYVYNPKLVRGLDYYCHTAFEFTTNQLGAQGTVLGGGRYDGLAELLGGPATPGIGWAAGIERLELLLGPLEAETPPLALIPLSESMQLKTLRMAQKLRSAGFKVDMGYSGNMKKRMARANKIKAHWALILGEDEDAKGKISLRNMQSGDQELCTQEALINTLHLRLAKEK